MLLARYFCYYSRSISSGICTWRLRGNSLSSWRSGSDYRKSWSVAAFDLSDISLQSFRILHWTQLLHTAIGPSRERCRTGQRACHHLARGRARICHWIQHSVRLEELHGQLHDRLRIGFHKRERRRQLRPFERFWIHRQHIENRKSQIRIAVAKSHGQECRDDACEKTSLRSSCTTVSTCEQRGWR